MTVSGSLFGGGINVHPTLFPPLGQYLARLTSLCRDNHALYCVRGRLDHCLGIIAIDPKLVGELYGPKLKFI